MSSNPPQTLFPDANCIPEYQGHFQGPPIGAICHVASKENESYLLLHTAWYQLKQLLWSVLVAVISVIDGYYDRHLIALVKVGLLGSTFIAVINWLIDHCQLSQSSLIAMINIGCLIIVDYRDQQWLLWSALISIISIGCLIIVDCHDQHWLLWSAVVTIIVGDHDEHW